MYVSKGWVLGFCMLCVSGFFLQGQEVEFCGFSLQHQKLDSYNKAYEAVLYDRASSKPDKDLNPAAQRFLLADQQEEYYYIPIVVHVLHLGESIGSDNNPTTSVLENFILQLNNSFQNQAARFDKDGNNIKIKFVLARRDKNFKNFTGILRYNAAAYYNAGSKSFSYDDAINHLALPYPTRGYANIWVVPMLQKATTLGNAYFPSVNDYYQKPVPVNNKDRIATGVRITATAIEKKRYNTIAHELGHFLNLAHTFSSGAASEALSDTECPERETDPYKQGDRCADTERHQKAGFIPIEGSLNVCTKNKFTRQTAFNLMSYYPDGKLFTQDQKDRMRASFEINPFRFAYKYSTVADLSFSGDPMKVVSTPKTEKWLGSTYQMNLTAISFGTTRYDAKPESGLPNSGGYHDLSTSHISRAFSGEKIPVQVSLVKSKNSQNIPTELFVLGYIDLNNDGSFSSQEKVFDQHGKSGLPDLKANIDLPSGVKKETFLRVRFISGSDQQRALTKRVTSADASQTDDQIANKGCHSCKVVDMGVLVFDKAKNIGDISLQFSGDLSHDGGEATFSIDYPGSWQAQSSATWIDIKSKTGKGKATVKFSYEKGGGSQDYQRCADIFVSALDGVGQEALLEVCQSRVSTAVTTWDIENLPSKIQFPATQQINEFFVITNAPFWHITFDDLGWLTPNSYSFTQQGAVSLLAKESIESVPRSTKLKIWDGKTLKKEIEIIQLSNTDRLSIPSEFESEPSRHLSPTYIESGGTYVYFNKERSGVLKVQLIDFSGNLVWEEHFEIQGQKQAYISLPAVGTGYYILRTRIAEEGNATKVFVK